MDSNVVLSPGSRHASDATPTGSTSGTTSTSVCEVDTSWSARQDFAFESAAGATLADVLNELIFASGEAPIAVNSRMDPGCVWSVAFSAPQNVDMSGTRHAATFAPMLRHPAGLWTAAPQAAGWLRVVDRASRAVWIPIADATGSAIYGEASCASLSAVRVSAFIPPEAAELSLLTAEGERTLKQLVGSEPSTRGWAVRFAFSADTTR